jgi:regulatory protein
MSDEIVILKLEKKKNKYLLTTSEKEYFFDEDTIIEYGLFKDQVFLKAKFDEILNKRDQNNAFNSSLRLLARGMKSVKEIEDYLQKKNISEDITEATILRLQSFGYLNDVELAKYLLQYYINNNKGPRYISQKLSEKKVARAVTEKVLEDYTEKQEEDIIIKLIDKLEPNNRNYPIAKQKQLLSDRLIRSGFSSNIVYSIINNTEFKDESDDQLLIDYEKQKRLLSNKDIDEYQKKQKIIKSLLNKGYEFHKISAIIE